MKSGTNARIIFQSYLKPMEHHFKESKGSTKLDSTSALKNQVGGTHYKSMSIQPIDFILANDLGFCEANAVKYICRYKQKNGVQDIDKAIHYLQILKERLNNVHSNGNGNDGDRP